MKKHLLHFFWLLPSLVLAQGGSVTNARYNTSLIGNTGTGGGFPASYGQLYFSAEEPINLDTTDWVAIPFDAVGPSYNLEGSTSSPATLTIGQTGVYQMNISLYFSGEDSDEGSFTETTYTMGIKTNDGLITAYAATPAHTAGNFSLSYSVIQEFSKNDTVQFYFRLNVPGFHPNIVTMQQGNAYLVQIAQ